MNTDLLLYNAEIIDIYDNFKRYNCISVKQDKIAEIGESIDIASSVSHSANAINLHGATLLTGFIDSHVHFTQTGLDEMSVKAEGYTDIESFYEDIIRHATNLDSTDWLICGTFNPLQMGLTDLPDRYHLDDLGIENPIFISRLDSHSCSLNTKAMEMIGVDIDIDGVDKDRFNKPTGIFRSEANAITRNAFHDYIGDTMREKAMNIAAQKALKAGVTFVHAMEGGGGLFSDKDVDVLRRIRDNLPINLTIYHQTMDTEKVLKEGFSQIGGCITLDGSIGSYTAAFKEPYADNKATRGHLYYTDDKISSFVQEAHRKSLQITTHCIGDRAIEQMLKAYEKIAGGTAGYRHRIEHFSIPDSEQIDRAVRLGLIISSQPVFDYYGYTYQDNMYKKRLGRERADRAYPLQSMIEKGLILAGGSDSPITPIHPLLGIHAAVNHSNQNERISIKDALKMFTVHGAFAVHQECNRGSLQKGNIADFVVLDRNPLEVSNEKIKDINVVMTILGGKIAYQRGDAK